MNKTTKGALALAAAVALTLGGAGSLAYWNASQSTNPVTFVMGSLGLSANNDAAWTRGSTVIAPMTDRLIPGDVLTFTQTFDATVVGDGMIVKATATVPVVSASSAPELSAITLSGAADVLSPVSGGWELLKSGTITATFTLTVPSTLTGNMNTSVMLTNATVTLEQVGSPLAPIPD